MMSIVASGGTATVAAILLEKDLMSQGNLEKFTCPPFKRKEDLFIRKVNGWYTEHSVDYLQARTG